MRRLQIGTGAAKFTSLVTGQYAQVREQFNVPLAALDRKSTRLNSSHVRKSRMPSSA